MYFFSARDWWHQYYRLGRKIRDTGVLSANDVMRARLLLETVEVSGAASPGGGTPPAPEEQSARLREAVKNLEEVREYGKRMFEKELRAGKAEALLDQDT